MEREWNMTWKLRCYTECIGFRDITPNNGECCMETGGGGKSTAGFVAAEVLSTP